MNGTISDAALPVVARYVGRTSNIYRYIAEDLTVVDAQIADEARKPEAVRLRDELRERAEFEAWAEKRGHDLSVTRDHPIFIDGVYENGDTCAAWTTWQAALAATGKQQVGAFPWENLPSYLIDKCEGDTISEEGIQRAVSDMAKDARYCMPQQVGEVQGDACFDNQMGSPAFEVWAKANGYSLHRDRSSLNYTGDTFHAYWAWRYLAARQPVEFERAIPTHRRESAVELLLSLGFVWNNQRWEDRRQPAQAVDLGQTRAIEMLLAVAEAAYNLADNANDMEDCENVEHADFVALSDALDALDELPDDQPGYTMSEPAKARWALRGLIDGQT